MCKVDNLNVILIITLLSLSVYYIVVTVAGIEKMATPIYGTIFIVELPITI